MLEVGLNSYCTVDEADEYIRSHFISTSEEVEIWDALSLDDKEVYLITSAESLNGLSFKGRKKIAGQALAFPRVSGLMPGIYILPIVYNQSADMTIISGAYGGDGLKGAKEAQIENAIAHCLMDPKTTKEVRHRVLSGIASERAGSISRSYNDVTNNHKSNLMMKGIYNPDKVEAKLKAWLSASIFSI